MKLDYETATWYFYVCMHENGIITSCSDLTFPSSTRKTFPCWESCRSIPFVHMVPLGHFRDLNRQPVSHKITSLSSQLPHVHVCMCACVCVWQHMSICAHTFPGLWIYLCMKTSACVDSSMCFCAFELNICTRVSLCVSHTQTLLSCKAFIHFAYLDISLTWCWRGPLTISLTTKQWTNEICLDVKSTLAPSYK